MLPIRDILLRTILPAACVVGIAYNAALTVNGPDGLRAAAALEAALATELAQADETAARVAALSARADGLLMASLDEDLLEESLRERLGLVAEGELMVRMDDLDRLASRAEEERDVRLASLPARRP